jgi:hypothetical protein
MMKMEVGKHAKEFVFLLENANMEYSKLCECSHEKIEHVWMQKRITDLHG